MAIAFDTVDDGTGINQFSATATTAITVGSLTNGILLIGVLSSDDTTPTVSSLTVGGSGTGVIAVPSGSIRNTGQLFAAMYYKLNPSSGSTAVALTLSGSESGVNVVAITLQGVDQATPFGTANTASGDSTAPSVTVTGVTGDWVVDAMTWGSVGGSFTATVGSGQTQRFNDGNLQAGAAMSTEVSGSTTTDMDWTLSSGRNWATVGVAVKASSGGGGGGGGSVTKPIWPMSYY